MILMNIIDARVKTIVIVTAEKKPITSFHYDKSDYIELKIRIIKLTIIKFIKADKYRVINY